MKSIKYVAAGLLLIGGLKMLSNVESTQNGEVSGASVARPIDRKGHSMSWMFRNKQTLAPEIRHTIEVLLNQVPVGVKDPAKYLMDMESFDHLDNSGIKDLTPLKYFKKLGNLIYPKIGLKI